VVSVTGCSTCRRVIHVEFQADYEADFPKRVYVYNYRVVDRMQCPVVSLVILGDDNPNWRPDRYRQDLWGCATEFRFPVLKLWDYNERWTELGASATRRRTSRSSRRPDPSAGSGR
jgi:hypothetical protein